MHIIYLQSGATPYTLLLRDFHAEMHFLHQTDVKASQDLLLEIIEYEQYSF